MRSRCAGVSLLVLAVFFVGAVVATCGGGGKGDGDVDDDDDGDLGRDAKVSDCGGFDGEQAGYGEPEDDDGDVRDELLLWDYEADAETVVFLNRNIWLNCCGEHSIEIFLDDKAGVYEISETDAPIIYEGEPARCGCMCFYDFAVSLPDVSCGVISVKLTRDVTDDGEPRYTVWEGEIDLADGSGEIVVDEDVGW